MIAILVTATALIGGLLITNSQKALEGKVVVDAEVVGFEKTSRFDTSNERYIDLYAEVVEYKVDSQKYKATNEVYSNTPKSIGQKMQIAYDPNDPSVCEFVGSKDMFIIAPFIFCGFFVLVGIGKVISDIKNHTWSEEKI
ncbi:MAG: hypothetical protein HFE32_07620 [Clostridia bacterium]|nr:hypothetical protein [Clostridia bacterium]